MSEGDFPVVGVDPGPMARLAMVIEQPETASVVFQRLSEGESLKDIAKAWGVPVGKFSEWYMMQHGEMYDAALRVIAAEVAQETLAIADEQAAVVKEDGGTFDPDVARDKLRIASRQWFAARADRQRYGEHTKVEHGGHVTGLIAVLSSLPSGRVVEVVKPDEPESDA